ncbi:MAG TPA: DUF2252 domain-containing protein [Gaiellaceae bacterium]|nr:DUF2252 domain-containing protein [Gaiellaceae bacterium]
MAKVMDTTDELAPPPEVLHFTAEERAARGKAARAEVPRTSHAGFELIADRDPVQILMDQAPSRVPELVPIRYGRMLVSPFTFYRGAAAIMAHDLAPTPRVGLHAQLCGDAHLANVGGYASPERDLVFDLNDFDETLPGPFEWDVKRLATSFEICARDRNFTKAQRETAVLSVVRNYREWMRKLAAMPNLQVWYARLDVATIEQAIRKQGAEKQAAAVAEAAAKARTKDSLKAFAKLTEEVDGEPRIVSDPPLIMPIRDLIDPAQVEQGTADLQKIFRNYRRTLQRDRRHLLEEFRWIDIARKVVGVGSVGTRCWILLLLGRDATDPLFLQIKEAQASVLEPYLGKSEYANHGQRVVVGQRVMQSVSDIFLGWVHVDAKDTLDGQPRDFYFRQLWDWKTSLDLDVVVPVGLELYAQICGFLLARAHARSGDRIAIAEYLGKGDTFDKAIAEFARAYADQNEKDYAELVQAGKDGRITVEAGL